MPHQFNVGDIVRYESPLGSELPTGDYSIREIHGSGYILDTPGTNGMVDDGWYVERHEIISTNKPHARTGPEKRPPNLLRLYVKPGGNGVYIEIPHGKDIASDDSMMRRYFERYASSAAEAFVTDKAHKRDIFQRLFRGQIAARYPRDGAMFGETDPEFTR